MIRTAASPCDQAGTERNSQIRSPKSAKVPSLENRSPARYCPGHKEPKRFKMPVSPPIRISNFGLRLLSLAVLFLGLMACDPALAEQRFPPPDFTESGHKLPETTTPPARAVGWDYVDVAVLAGALGVAVWLIYRQRSRRGLFWLGLFSLVYFGFYRKGCVCPIGSVQNVSVALLGEGYAIPVSVLAFFVFPLAVALFAGRAFCAGVCPHGALQDLVLVKPLKVPAWLEHALGLFPFLFLGAGVWVAVTCATFLFCEYDPLVPVFRMSGRLTMVLTGIGLLLVGTVVGRPYCRFLCPYGALLKLAAVFSAWRVRVTLDYCTQCKLCEAACPFGAMREPGAIPADPVTRARERRRVGVLLLLLPVLMVALGWLGGRLSNPAARLHPDVALAERLLTETNAAPETLTQNPDDLALWRAQETAPELLRAAAVAQHRFKVGGCVFGLWMGLVIGIKLISLAVRRTRTDYEPDRGDCLACARCFSYCPNELVRRGWLPANAIPAPPPVSPRP